MTGKEASLSLELVDVQKQLELYKKQHVAVLGDGEVFVRRTKDGIIKSVKGRITLSEANGEIATISGKTMTTGKGLNVANQITSLSIITPEKMTLPEGQVVVNPFPIIDPESQTIRKFWVKKMAVGYGPTGNLVLTSATLLYDINMYFIQDLLKKITYNKGAGRVCFEQMLTDEEKKTGIFYKIDGGMGVWADVDHKEILKAVDTFVNKKQFAERNAQTIAERLVMVKHPALSHIAYVDAQGAEKRKTANVMLVGYVTDMDQGQLLELAQKAEKGEEVKVDGKPVEIIETTAEATYDEMNAHVDDEERMQQEGVGQEPEKKPESNSGNKNGIHGGGLFDKSDKF